jgi:hypothetical protein
LEQVVLHYRELGDVHAVAGTVFLHNSLSEEEHKLQYCMQEHALT